MLGIVRAGAGAMQVHAAVSQHVVALLNSSDDDGIIQSCCEYWRCASSRALQAHTSTYSSVA